MCWDDSPLCLLQRAHQELQLQLMSNAVIMRLSQEDYICSLHENPRLWDYQLTQSQMTTWRPSTLVHQAAEEIEV